MAVHISVLPVVFSLGGDRWGIIWATIKFSTAINQIVTQKSQYCIQSVFWWTTVDLKYKSMIVTGLDLFKFFLFSL